MPTASSALRRRLSTPAVLVPGLVLGGLLLLYVAALLLTVGQIPRGTTVDGLEIGGKSRAAASRTLQQQLVPVRQKLQVVAADTKLNLDTSEAGLSVDVDATVDQAAARSLNPVGVIRQLFAGREVAPVLDVDRPALAAALDRMAAKVDRKLREGAITFAGDRPVVSTPLSGRTLDRKAGAVALQAAFEAGTSPAWLPVTVTKPKVTDAELDRAMREFAEPAVAAPVTLELGGRSISVEPAEFAPTITLTADTNGTLVPKIHAEKLSDGLADRIGGLVQPPEDARFVIRNGKPVIIPAKDGVRLEPASLAQGLLDVLPQATGRVVKTGLVTAEPEFSTADAEALGIKEKVSSFTTRYPYAAYRLTNIHRAADLINSTLLEPGDTFSLNGIVGERTAANGFAVGTIIKGGRFFKDYGGGVSQVATTTFNAMYFAGLKDVEHHPHSFYISRYPAGREATVAWGAKDLRFTNDSPSGILLTASYTSSTVTVTLWGTKTYDVSTSSSARYRYRDFKVVYDESPTCVKQEGVRGFDIDVTRVVRQGGGVVKRQTFHTRYNPADEIHCSPEPTPEPTPTPGPAPTPGPTPTVPPPAE